MRVAAVDVGTNSTRLLVADVSGGSLTEVERCSVVTRLGEGVEATGRLGNEPQARVLLTLVDYVARIARHGCDASATMMTSAVRDAANGDGFAARVHALGLDARTLSGDEEARLTFLGAVLGRDPEGLAVLDIGGGSTEIVMRDFHVSTQLGVVRHGERHSDTNALAADSRRVLEAAVPAAVRARVAHVVAVAGTPTSAAAMDLQLDPYDAARVEGHRLTTTRLREQLDRLRALSPEGRRDITGLHPDRAPVIVPGLIILLEALAVLGRAEVEVSEHDILWGAALELAGNRNP